MIIISFIAVAALVLIDQIIKIVVVNNIEIGQSISVIKFGNNEIFNLTHILNDGAGFSIFSGKTFFLVLMTVVLIIVATVYLIKFAKRHPLLITSLTLIIAGGVGNLIDRVFRNGLVIDYIEARFIDFPIFNFADICVTFGAIFLIVYIIFFDKSDEKVTKENLNQKADKTDTDNE